MFAVFDVFVKLLAYVCDRQHLKQHICGWSSAVGGEGKREGGGVNGYGQRQRGKKEKGMTMVGAMGEGCIFGRQVYSGTICLFVGGKLE